MKVVFVAPFDYTPSKRRQVTYVYQPNPEPVTVKRECGEQAIAKGCAVLPPSEGPDNGSGEAE